MIGGAKSLRLFACAGLLALASGCATMPAAQVADAGTMEVRGRHIYTAAGEKVVLRGVNEMFAWSDDPTGERTLPQIALTGANAVRLVTTPDTTTAQELDALLAGSIANGLIPMPECHAATGKWEKLGECVAYWARPDIAAVIERHRRWTLLNIANEAGAEVSAADYTAGYRDAIARIRAAGITVPLVIDGSGWGQEYRILLDSWAELNAADPRGQVIVSAHSYWVGTEEERKAPYRAIIARVLRDDIPFVLGEGPTPTGYDCQPSPYGWAMTELERAQIGWLAWSWGTMDNGDCKEEGAFDITVGGRYGEWETEAGEALMVGHPASVRNTSRRPCSIPNAGANCVRPAPLGAAVNAEALPADS